MTEAEWWASSDPKAMLDLLASRLRAGRQMRLFAAAAARDNLNRSRSSIPHEDGDDLEFEAAILRVEAYADGRGDLRYDQSLYSIEWFDDLEAACWVLGYDPDCFTWIRDPAEHIKQYRVNPAHWLRDIFGNPFRSVTIDAAWRTDSVLSVARGMDESGDFSGMPVLGHTLEEAGCGDEQVLGHCRGVGPHVRGCWVVDLLLGKE
jgi:hypothetical protein